MEILNHRLSVPLHQRLDRDRSVRPGAIIMVTDAPKLSSHLTVAPTGNVFQHVLFNRAVIGSDQIVIGWQGADYFVTQLAGAFAACSAIFDAYKHIHRVECTAEGFPIDKFRGWLGLSP